MARQVLMDVATTNAPTRIGAGLRSQNGPVVRDANTVRKSESDTWERTSRTHRREGGNVRERAFAGWIAWRVASAESYLEVHDCAQLAVGERVEAQLLEVRVGFERTQHGGQQLEGGADRDAAKHRGQQEQLLQCGDPGQTDHSMWVARRAWYVHGCSGVHLDIFS
jgi:hypothetical protein